MTTSATKLRALRDGCHATELYDALEAMTADRDALASRLEGAREVLTRVQWLGEGGFWEEGCCPECRASGIGPKGAPPKHADDCELARALASPAAPTTPTDAPPPETQFFCRGCGHAWTSHGKNGCGASTFNGPCLCPAPSPTSKESDHE